MKLSPLDIQHMEFGGAVSGYQKKQVRDFLERVAAEREELLREQQELREELQKKEQRIEELQVAEVELKRAVIAAERIGNELKQNAKREAELMIKEAEQLKENIIRDAETRIREARTELSRLERQQRMFREQLRGMLRAFERSLDDVTQLTPPPRGPNAPVTAAAADVGSPTATPVVEQE